MSDYYTDKDIAALLNITVPRLRNKLNEGRPLPPRIKPPESRHRLWPKKAVHEWLAQYLEQDEVSSKKIGAYF